MDKIASGGYGTLYKTKNQKLGYSAIKRIKIRKNLGNILKEINTMRFMRHPNILQFYSLNIKNVRNTKVADIETELWDSDLYDHLDKHRLSLEDSFRVFLKVLNPLILMHQNGIYHLDVKPSNVLVKVSKDTIKEVCLCDFGCGSYMNLYTYTNIGTIITRSPENFSSRATGNMFNYIKSITESGEFYCSQTDVFACGVLFLYLLTNEYLFYIGECDNNKDYPEQVLCEYLGNPKDFITKKIVRYKNYPEYNNIFDILVRMLDPCYKKRPELIEIYKDPLFEKFNPMKQLQTQIRVSLAVNYNLDLESHRKFRSMLNLCYDLLDSYSVSYKLFVTFLDLSLKVFMEKNKMSEFDLISCLCIAFLFFNEDDLISDEYIRKNWDPKEIELNCLNLAKLLKGNLVTKSPFWYCNNLKDFEATLSDYFEVNPYLHRKIHQTDQMDKSSIADFDALMKSESMKFMLK